MSEVEEIAKLYLEKKVLPKGSLLGTSRIWYPDTNEVRDCCIRFMRRASHARPKIVYNHCQSLEHYARRFSVPLKDLRHAVKELRHATT